MNTLRHVNASALQCYLEEGHVLAVIAVGLIVVRVVDEWAVFLWVAVTCGNRATKKLP